ncbi:MAG: TetR family transcriptional regulator [Bacteroidota bacterium]
MGGLNKREHLIRTGQELIWAKGYALCSIKDITTAAGLPKGSFYHYFDSKEKFALEAMEDYLDTFPEQSLSDPADFSSLEHMLDKRIEAVIQIQFARECYMSVMCHASVEQEESFREAVVAGINKSNEAMSTLLSSLAKQGLISSDFQLNELMEFVDFSWRGARLKAKMLQSAQPLLIFKKYLLQLIR